jgi:chromosome segregation ATPase
MTESTSHGAKPAKTSLGKHALVLFMGFILFGNLYVIFSLRETLLKYEEKIHDIQSNTNLISDRVYDLDARLTADELTFAEVRDGISETTVLLELTQQEVDASSKKLTATMRYLDQLAEALNYEERLDVLESEAASIENFSPITPASEQQTVDPEGSMEWTDPTGKIHTVKFRSGRVLETIE